MERERLCVCLVMAVVAAKVMVVLCEVLSCVGEGGGGVYLQHPAAVGRGGYRALFKCIAERSIRFCVLVLKNR